MSMSKLDAVLERQRQYGLRDWLIGLIALMVVLFHFTAFSRSEPLPMNLDVMEQAELVSPAQMIDEHTAAACGDYERAAEDLRC